MTLEQEKTTQKDVCLESVDIVSVAEKILEKADGMLDELIVDTQSFKQITAALKDLNEIVSRKTGEITQFEIVLHAGSEAWNG